MSDAGERPARAFVASPVEPVQGPITELTAATFDRAMGVNARAVVLGAIAAARAIDDGRGGSSRSPRPART